MEGLRPHTNDHPLEEMQLGKSPVSQTGSFRTPGGTNRGPYRILSLQLRYALPSVRSTARSVRPIRFVLPQKSVCYFEISLLAPLPTICGCSFPPHLIVLVQLACPNHAVLRPWTHLHFIFIANEVSTDAILSCLLAYTFSLFFPIQ